MTSRLAPLKDTGYARMSLAGISASKISITSFTCVTQPRILMVTEPQRKTRNGYFSGCEVTSSQFGQLMRFSPPWSLESGCKVVERLPHSGNSEFHTDYSP